MTARILFLDIETAPSLGWVWQKFDATVIDFKSDWYILSFAYKWADEEEVYVYGLDDMPGYDPASESDELLVNFLWKLLNKADIVVAHNGKKFDIRKINTRFLTHKLPPPAPYKIVDTLLIARRVFAFDSNKLDDLGRYLGIGRKLPTTGFHLWRGVMQGDSDSWITMKSYNKKDVELLEEVYYLIRSWDSGHPNVNQGEPEACPKCSSKSLQRRGFSYTALRRKQRYRCNACLGWFDGPAQAIKGAK